MVLDRGHLAVARRHGPAQPAEEAAPPPFLQLRYDEDYSYLQDPEKRRTFVDRTSLDVHSGDRDPLAAGLETYHPLFPKGAYYGLIVMTASALLRNGVQHVATMREGLERWLGENGYDSVDAIRGLKDATHVENVDALIRAKYVEAQREYLPGRLV